MGIDLDLDADQQMIADSVRKLLKQARPATARQWDGAFDPAIWLRLGEMGLWQLGASKAEGCFGHIAAACEALGLEGVAGPVAATMLAGAIVPDGRLADGLYDGSLLVALGAGRALPWGILADLHISIRDTRLVLLNVSAREAIPSLSDEHWATVTSTDAADLGALEQVRHIHDLALAAYLVGAGRFLIDFASTHVRQRKQFGKTLGEFQGVAFPLADVVMRVDAAQTLTRIAALKLDRQRAQGPQMALAARLVASRAAMASALTAHQVLGALGMLADGPVFWLSRRIQQWAVQSPSDADARRDFRLDTVGIVGALESQGATPARPAAMPAIA